MLDCSTNPYLPPTPVSLPHVNSLKFDDIIEDIESDESTTKVTPEDSTSSIQSQPPLRRSTRQSKQPSWLGSYVIGHSAANINQVTDHVVNPIFHCFLSTLAKITYPTSFSQAVQSPHWIQAMNDELDAFENNKTWIITTLPPGKKAIGSIWLYKTKFKPDGSIDKFKSRLVILGNKQTYSIDYSETFAPVAKLTIMRTLLKLPLFKIMQQCRWMCLIHSLMVT